MKRARARHGIRFPKLRNFRVDFGKIWRSRKWSKYHASWLLGPSKHQYSSKWLAEWGLPSKKVIPRQGLLSWDRPVAPYRLMQKIVVFWRLQAWKLENSINNRLNRFHLVFLTCLRLRFPSTPAHINETRQSTAWNTIFQNCEILGSISAKFEDLENDRNIAPPGSSALRNINIHPNDLQSGVYPRRK